MHINQRKEQFSRAYVQAVAAMAGFAHYTPSVDDDSVDMGLAARSQMMSTAPRFEMQVKCTGGELLDGINLAFDLPRKNYDDLRCDTQVPRILVVVLVPELLEDWATQDETMLAMYRCGYWLSLSSYEPSNNESTIRVHLPRTQMFTVQQVTALMERAHQGVPL